MKWKRAGQDTMRCSFCHKPQGEAVKLISSPSDFERAYICDACVAVCASIIKDDPSLTPPQRPHRILAAGEGHPFLFHTLASQFFEQVEEWMFLETDGRDASHALSEMRRTAAIMIADEAPPT